MEDDHNALPCESSTNGQCKISSTFEIQSSAVHTEAFNNRQELLPGDAGDHIAMDSISSHQSSHRFSFLKDPHLESQSSDQWLNGNQKQRCENLRSPEGQRFIKYQSPGKGSMRHQLLVQRTFSPHHDGFEPRTSSPMRKVRVCTVDTRPSENSHVNEGSVARSDTVFTSPVNSGVGIHNGQDKIFKTPIRTQHLSGDSTGHYTPHRPLLSLYSSPASGSSSVFTPGRPFVNPFETDHDRLHMPVFSPSVFKVGASTPKENEGFWSLEHTAMLMPIDIKDSDVQRQFRHQRRIDREQDAKVQSAVNAFFSNNQLIAPSPWSEKVSHFLPRTPGSIKTVSCQTTLSVPPGVDLIAELGEKYQLPECKTDTPTSDSLGNSFIRRKLLNQLNENDNEILGSPILAPRSSKETPSSISPSPIRRQSTPEWEHQTPNKQALGHFSSSPIREEPDERGHNPALSESDLLASPELSPVAGRRSVRSSAIYYSEHDTENPRAIMQLDFSSILDEDSDDNVEDSDDKPGTLTQQTVSDKQLSEQFNHSHGVRQSHDLQQMHMSSISLLEGDNLNNTTTEQLSRPPLLHSGISCESALDMVSCSTSGPQLGSSQDTGYQTASLALSTSNLPSLESGITGSELATRSSESVTHTDFVAGLLPDMVTRSTENVAHTDLTSEFTNLKSKDGSFASSGSAAISKDLLWTGDEVDISSRKREPGMVRKIRALSDLRQHRERKNVSRDLTQSFNLNCSSNSDNARFNFQANDSVQRSDNATDISIHSAISLQLNSSPQKRMPLRHSKSECTFESYKMAHDVNEERVSGGFFQSKFSLGDDGTLEQARKLLGKSEQLRQRHLHASLSLEDDTFHQAMLASDENTDPCPSLSNQLSSCFNQDSSPSSRILENVEANIKSIKSSKLGSEIAAEILKRAGDDLAELTDN